MDEVLQLNALICEHHRMFAELHPELVIPKFHWVLHMAIETLLCGPLRWLTCLRLEAAHQYFKRLVKSRGINWRGFVPATLARRRARWVAGRIRAAMLSPSSDVHHVGVHEATPVLVSSPVGALVVNLKGIGSRFKGIATLPIAFPSHWTWLHHYTWTAAVWFTLHVAQWLM